MKVRLVNQWSRATRAVLIPVHDNDPVCTEIDFSILGFSGVAGTSADVFEPGVRLSRYVGLGPSEQCSIMDLRRAIANGAQGLPPVSTLGIDLSKVEGDPNELARAAAIAVPLALYQFDVYRTPDIKAPRELVLCCPGAKPAALREAEAIVRAVTFARDLVNEPGGSLTPTEFARRAKERAVEAGLHVKVMGRREIERARLGGLLAVSRGSAQEPKFVELRYEPSRPAGPSVALVGKGLTFDSGGLSIKPADGMMTMKMDMGGGAAVIAAMCALAPLGVRVPVRGYVPMTDNMLGPDAQRPGDIFRARNGTTVEVLNTDAEGRLVLAEALNLASEADPDIIIDLATLTGACMVALGPSIAGLLTNNDDLGERLIGAGAAVGERLWRLPLAPEYKKMIESPIADLKNIGGRYGGTITAALFLESFVSESASWAHLDIAGPAYSEDGSGETGVGGTGFGVQTLLELLKNLA